MKYLCSLLDNWASIRNSRHSPLAGKNSLIFWPSGCLQSCFKWPWPNKSPSRFKIMSLSSLAWDIGVLSMKPVANCFIFWSLLPREIIVIRCRNSECNLDTEQWDTVAICVTKIEILNLCNLHNCIYTGGTKYSCEILLFIWYVFFYLIELQKFHLCKYVMEWRIMACHS